MVDEVEAVYTDIRETVDESFGKKNEQAVRMAAQIDVEPAKPRAAGRQRHRANAPAENVKDYFRRNMAVSFLDHIITEFEAHFSELSVKSSMLLGLIPSIQCGQDVPVDISEPVEIYQEDLPSPELMDQELKRWRLKWQGKSSEQTPTSCAQAIKECDALVYPSFSELPVLCL